jgi:hypothetical protein
MGIGADQRKEFPHYYGSPEFTVLRHTETTDRAADALGRRSESLRFTLEYRPGKLPDALSRREQDMPREGDERLQFREKRLLNPEVFKGNVAISAIRRSERLMTRQEPLKDARLYITKRFVFKKLKRTKMKEPGKPPQDPTRASGLRTLLQQGERHTQSNLPPNSNSISNGYGQPLPTLTNITSDYDKQLVTT